jgi:hypothetical protein
MKAGAKVNDKFFSAKYLLKFFYLKVYRTENPALNQIPGDSIMLKIGRMSSPKQMGASLKVYSRPITPSAPRKTLLPYSLSNGFFLSALAVAKWAPNP